MVDVYSSIMTDAYPLTLVLLMITSSLLAILYMVSKFINSKKLESWIVNEVFQCLATALFLFLAVGLLTAVADISGIFISEIAKQNNLNEVNDLVKANRQSELHISFAYAYLLTRLDKLNKVYDWLFYTYTISATLSSTAAFFPGHGGTPIGLGVSKGIATIIESFIGYTFYGFLFVYIQLGILELAKAYFFHAFPAGIVLRAFPFTRSLGSFLIASSIGLYFVYPFFLSVLLLSNTHTLDVKESDIISAVKREYPSQFLVYWIQQKLTHKSVDEEITASGISTITSFIQFTLLTMILFPLISFTATYTFIHQFAALMQANVADLGRGLIRLV
ncbi:MAG: hypothetical protein ACP5KJ_01660 [Candidatus Micrarchaeia archaeon]